MASREQVAVSSSSPSRSSIAPESAEYSRAAEKPRDTDLLPAFRLPRGVPLRYHGRRDNRTSAPPVHLGQIKAFRTCRMRPGVCCATDRSAQSPVPPMGLPIVLPAFRVLDLRCNERRSYCGVQVLCSRRGQGLREGISGPVVRGMVSALPAAQTGTQ